MPRRPTDDKQRQQHSERDKGKRAFKYHGAVVSYDGSKPEGLSRIAQATAAFTKLKPIWRDNKISLGSKVKLMCSFFIFIFLKACESWTLTAELEKRMQAFEMRCYRSLLNSSYKDHATNEEVRRKIQAAIGEYDELLTLVKKRKLRWFGHVLRSSGLAKIILQSKNKKNITVFLKKMQLLTTCYIALFCIGKLT